MRAYLHSAHTYAGRLELEGLERFAPRELVQSKFEEAGFASVAVYDANDVPTWFPASLLQGGSGVLYVVGTWTGASIDVEMPDQVHAIVDVTPAAAPAAQPGRGGPAFRLNMPTLGHGLDSDFIFVAVGLRLAILFW